MKDILRRDQMFFSLPTFLSFSDIENYISAQNTEIFTESSLATQSPLATESQLVSSAIPMASNLTQVTGPASFPDISLKTQKLSFETRRRSKAW